MNCVRVAREVHKLSFRVRELSVYHDRFQPCGQHSFLGRQPNRMWRRHDETCDEDVPLRLMCRSWLLSTVKYMHIFLVFTLRATTLFAFETLNYVSTPVSLIDAISALIPFHNIDISQRLWRRRTSKPRLVPNGTRAPAARSPLALL